MSAYFDAIDEQIGALTCATGLIWELENTGGGCDRCTECAIESVYSNEMEYGGTSEYVRDALGIPYGSGRCVRLLDAVVGRTMEYQAQIWRGVGQ
jgi:hypothetical protein